MKNESEVREQLEKVYEYRLSLRIDRKMKRMCRNCINGVCREFDLGQFGVMSRWECRNGEDCQSANGCGFSCRWTEQDIENEMVSDISDPSVCGAKEPKIAMLMWMLHDGSSSSSSNKIDSRQESDGIIGKLKRLFS